MSTKANPTLIGLFVVTGLALAVVGIVTFGSGRLFSDKTEFILYFNDTMKGLNPGAPVKWQGVTIGSVKEVMILHNQATNDFANPVLIEIDEEILQQKADGRLDLTDPTFLKSSIERGLRGKLDSDSLVTGVLHVELDMVANAPLPVFHQVHKEYLEIPTSPSTIQELLGNLGSVDFKGISEKVSQLLSRVDKGLSELDVKGINAGLTNLLLSANRAVASPELTNSFTELRNLLAEGRVLVKRLDGRVDPLADETEKLMVQAQRTLDKLSGGLEQVAALIRPNAPFRTDVTAALEQLATAARAIGELADFLRLNPNALLTGRKPPAESP
jgi:paraquat-inducible protein B